MQLSRTIGKYNQCAASARQRNLQLLLTFTAIGMLSRTHLTQTKPVFFKI